MLVSPRSFSPQNEFGGPGRWKGKGRCPTSSEHAQCFVRSPPNFQQVCNQDIPVKKRQIAHVMLTALKNSKFTART